MDSEMGEGKKKITGDTAQVTLVAMALLTCLKHNHNFAVIHVGYERMVVADPEAVDCLQASGVDI